MGKSFLLTLCQCGGGLNTDVDFEVYHILGPIINVFMSTLPSQSSPYPFLDTLPEKIPLFHYTGVDGLLGMLRDKKLWMTNIHYQNDSQEYYHGFKILRDIISETYPDLLTNEQLDVLCDAKMSGNFTFSLSEEPDSLSQWRGYCPNGGYSISFDAEYFNKIIKQNHLLLGKCMYDREEQRDFIIKNVIKINPEEYKDYNDNLRNKVSARYNSEIFHITSLRRYSIN